MNSFLTYIQKLTLVLLCLANFLPGREYSLESPGKVLRLNFSLRKGIPYYSLWRLGQPVIENSKLGIVLKEDKNFDSNFEIEKITQKSFDEIWSPVWGEASKIRNNYNELKVHLRGKNKKTGMLILIFRVFDDGVGFRYIIPAQEDLKYINIMDELTEFNLPGNYRCWWIPAYRPNRYEYLYKCTSISLVDTAHTPLTIETDNGLYISIHEANLTDYASMTLARKLAHNLEIDLVPWSDGTKVKGKLPLKSPWRTIQVADTPGGLITSYLVLNLNDPCKLKDISWIRPGKYMGIWWEMHIGKSTWSSGPKHGATTENAKKYIDFASKYGFDGVLIEGWNIGWDSDWTAGYPKMNFLKPYKDFGIYEVTRYAKEKGVFIIGHHETGADILNYEKQMKEAFELYEQLGVPIVKTGYVGYGKCIPRIDEKGNLVKEWHHGQYIVRHYRKVIEEAAKHHIMIIAHEPIKDTGIRRTYPNMMSREGARGQEYNAWSPDGGNPPEHTTILPFTRLLAGPMDFTPGIFDLTFDKYRPKNRINTTLAKQLALYVVIYSPFQLQQTCQKTMKKDWMHSSSSWTSLQTGMKQRCSMQRLATMLPSQERRKILTSGSWAA